jgi:hypothetical protein
MSKFLIAYIYPNDFLLTSEKEFIDRVHFGKFNVGDEKVYIHKEYKPHEYIDEDENEIYYIDLAQRKKLLDLFNFNNSADSYSPLEKLQIDSINYVRLHTDKYIFFQKITKKM